VAVDHRLLHRVQLAAGRGRLQVLDVNSALPSSVGRKRMQAFTGRSDSAWRARGLAVGQLGHDHRAGAAVAFGAALLGAGAARVLAQPFEHAARGGGTVDARRCAPRCTKRIGRVSMRVPRWMTPEH
jgi:hypothetical protein